MRRIKQYVMTARGCMLYSEHKLLTICMYIEEMNHSSAVQAFPDYTSACIYLSGIEYLKIKSVVRPF